jgi:hypothetical protein
MLHFFGSLAAPSRVKWAGTQRKEPAMLKKIALAAAALAFAAPAFADGWHHGQYRHYNGPRYYGYYHRPVVVVRAPRVYYAPPPVFYAPPPVAYAPPPSLYIQGRSNGIAFSLGLPL